MTTHKVNLTLVGAGRLGSRHLEALIKLDRPMAIDVVEPSEDAQKAALAQLEALPIPKDKVALSWSRDLKGTRPGSDFCIVATTAQNRHEVLQQLLRSGHRQFLIEKMVTQSKAHYQDLITEFSRVKAKGWINCTRRMFPFYEQLAGLLKDAKGVAFSVQASNFGLGCNAIHFLDLFTFLARTPKIECDGRGLQPGVLPNRRGKDLLEFAGTIVAQAPGGHHATVTFHPDNEDGGAVVNVLSDSVRAFVDEGRRKAMMATKASGWQWQDHPYQELYTSALTTTIAQKVLNGQELALPTLEDSFPLHSELFKIFGSHIKSATGSEPELCPIT